MIFDKLSFKHTAISLKTPSVSNISRYSEYGSNDAFPKNRKKQNDN